MARGTHKLEGGPGGIDGIEAALPVGSEHELAVAHTLRQPGLHCSL